MTRAPFGVGGSLIPAAIVARWVGRDPRTIRAWIRRGILPGTCVAGRWYVQRVAALRLRAGDTPVAPCADTKRPD